MSFFRTARSAPHFTTQPRVQPYHGWMERGQRGDQATENARYATPHGGQEERPRLSRERTWSGFGVLHGMWREPPENWVVGVRNE